MFNLFQNFYLLPVRRCKGMKNYMQLRLFKCYLYVNSFDEALNILNYLKTSPLKCYLFVFLHLYL